MMNKTFYNREYCIAWAKTTILMLYNHKGSIEDIVGTP
jgi:hypothetical protein